VTPNERLAERLAAARSALDALEVIRVEVPDLTDAELIATNTIEQKVYELISELELDKQQ
jgi:hypothetical protein